jgi:hypothetical protein
MEDAILVPLSVFESEHFQLLGEVGVVLHPFNV